MNIQGFQKMTLLDFPGRVACTVFTGGCNLRCPFCHNGGLVRTPMEHGNMTEVVFDYLSRRRGILDGVCLTGGEPLLYPLDYLTQRLHEHGLEIFLETSGSHPLSGEFDWICLSPKRKQPPLAEAFAAASELKVIIETEEDLRWAEECAAKVGERCMLFMQPEWSRSEQMTPAIVEYVKAHPKWNISIQIHKFMHIP